MSASVALSHCPTSPSLFPAYSSSTIGLQDGSRCPLICSSTSLAVLPVYQAPTHGTDRFFPDRLQQQGGRISKHTPGAITISPVGQYLLSTACNSTPRNPLLQVVFCCLFVFPCSLGSAVLRVPPCTMVLVTWYDFLLGKYRRAATLSGLVRAFCSHGERERELAETCILMHGYFI